MLNGIASAFWVAKEAFARSGANTSLRHRARKVAIQGSRANLCLLGDAVQAGVGSGPRERLFCHLQNALAIPLSIRARLSPKHVVDVS